MEMMSDSDDSAAEAVEVTKEVDEDENDPYEVLYEGMVKRKSGGGGGRTLKLCQMRIYADGVVVDLGVEREYTLLDVAEWQIDRKKIKDATLTDAGLRVDCRGDEDRVVTLWLVLPSEQERHKWKVFLMAALHPDSKEGQRVRQLVAQQRQQDKIRVAEIERTREALAQAKKPVKKKPVAAKSTRALLPAGGAASTEPSGWQKYTSDDGQVYYYNATTQESRWTLEADSPPKRSKRRESAARTPDRATEPVKRQSSTKKVPKSSRNKANDDSAQPPPVVETSSSGSDEEEEATEGAPQQNEAEPPVDPALARLEKSRRMMLEASEEGGAPPLDASAVSKKQVSFKEGPSKNKDVANALEMMLGRGPPPAKLTKMNTSHDDEVPKSSRVEDTIPDDPTLTTAERLRLKRQQRQNQMFTTDDVDDTDLFLQNLAAKAKQKSASDPAPVDDEAAAATDPFQFPMDEWLDVEQEILFQPQATSPATKVAERHASPNDDIDQGTDKPKTKKKSKKKAAVVAAPPPPPPPAPEPPRVDEPRKKTKSKGKKKTRPVPFDQSSEDEVVIVESPPPPEPTKENTKRKKSKKATRAAAAAPPPAAVETKTPSKRVNILSDTSGSDSAPSPAAKDTPHLETATPALQQPHETASVKSPTRVSQAPPTAPTWTTHTAPDGREYYFNTLTQTSVWDKPIELLQQQPVPEQPVTPPVAPSRQPQPTPLMSPSLTTMTAYVSSSALIPPHVKIDTSICPHCHATPPTQRCVECESVFCDACCANHHLRYGSMFNHTMALLSVPFCHSCEASSASQTCVECQVNLCDACASFLHRKPPKHLHKRVPVYQHVSSDPPTLGPRSNHPQGSPIVQTMQPQPMVYTSPMPQQALLYQPLRPLQSADVVASATGFFVAPNANPTAQVTTLVVAAAPAAATAAPHMPRCATCGGWGVDLISASRSVCDHCDRLAKFQPQTKLGDVDWDDGDEDDDKVAVSSGSSSSSGWE